MYTMVSVPMSLMDSELHAMQQCDSLDLEQPLERERLEILEHLATV